VCVIAAGGVHPTAWREGESVKYLTRAFKVAVVLGIASFVGLAVAVAGAVVEHAILVPRYGDDLSSLDDTLPMFAAVWAARLAGIVSGLVALVVGWRRLVMGRSPVDSRRLAWVLGWSLVGWVAAGVAGNVLYGSANALVYLIAVGFGVAAHLVLLFRDRRRAMAQHRSTSSNARS
jgi:hypothetical protein